VTTIHAVRRNRELFAGCGYRPQSHGWRAGANVTYTTILLVPSANHPESMKDGEPGDGRIVVPRLLGGLRAGVRRQVKWVAAAEGPFPVPSGEKKEKNRRRSDGVTGANGALYL